MRRDPGLDGLRGLAAVAVVLSHVCAMTWVPDNDGPVPTTIHAFLWSLGAPAVDMFFVLSGYVLTAGLERDFSVVRYWISRLVRLLPVAWLGLGAGLTLRSVARYLPNGASLSMANLLYPIAARDHLGWETFLLPANSYVVNPPLWTLFLETRVSMLMPGLAGLAGIIGFWIVPAAFLLGCGLAYTTGDPTWLFTVQFALGAAVRRMPCIHMSPRIGNMVLAAGLLILMERSYTGWTPEIARLATMCGAAAMIVAIRSGAARPLGSPALVALGRISYPLYVLHYPVMALTVIGIGANVGITEAALISILPALALAWLFERIVDRPAIWLSRRIGRKADRTARNGKDTCARS